MSSKTTDQGLAFDGFDLDLGERLAVTVLHAIAFAAFLFEDDDFVTLDVAEDACFDACAAYMGCSDGYTTVVFDQVYIAERDGVPFLGCQPVDEDLLTFLNFKLLTGDGNNCEHVDNQKISELNFLFCQKARKGTVIVRENTGFGKYFLQRH
jgi:hypothetical protein